MKFILCLTKFFESSKRERKDGHVVSLGRTRVKNERMERNFGLIDMTGKITEKWMD